MPNIKSQKKRMISSRGENERNNRRKTQIRNLLKRFGLAVDEKRVDDARELLSAAVSRIQSAVAAGVYHKNAASRKIAQCSKRFETLKNAEA